MSRPNHLHLLKDLSPGAAALMRDESIALRYRLTCVACHRNWALAFDPTDETCLALGIRRIRPHEGLCFDCAKATVEAVERTTK